VADLWQTWRTCGRLVADLADLWQTCGRPGGLVADLADLWQPRQDLDRVLRCV
jgi:hypothetical protein